MLLCFVAGKICYCGTTTSVSFACFVAIELPHTLPVRWLDPIKQSIFKQQRKLLFHRETNHANNQTLVGRQLWLKQAVLRVLFRSKVVFFALHKRGSAIKADHEWRWRRRRAQHWGDYEWKKGFWLSVESEWDEKLWIVISLQCCGLLAHNNSSSWRKKERRNQSRELEPQRDEMRLKRGKK